MSGAVVYENNTVLDYDDPMRHKIFDAAGDLAEERYPTARGVEGHMQRIAREEFGVRLGKDRQGYWNRVTVLDKNKFLLFLLTH